MLATKSCSLITQTGVLIGRPPADRNDYAARRKAEAKPTIPRFRVPGRRRLGRWTAKNERRKQSRNDNPRWRKSQLPERSLAKIFPRFQPVSRRNSARSWMI